MPKYLDLEGLKHYHDKTIPYVTLEMFGAKCDGVTDDTEAIRTAISEVPTGAQIVLPSTKSVLVTEEIVFDKDVDIDFRGTVILKNTGRFTFGSSSFQYKANRVNINKLVGDGANGQTIALSLVYATYNVFTIHQITNVKYGIVFNYGKQNVSLGQNIFYFNFIRNCDEGIYFRGANSWAESSWAEGNQFMGGFVVQCNIGLHFEPNIKCGCTIYFGAIDCMEVANSYDIVDHTTSDVYHMKNLIISNFFRLSACDFPRDISYFETQAGLNTAGQIISCAGMQADNGTNITALTPGSIEIANTDAPFIDLKSDRNEDRDCRIVSTGDTLKFSAGDTSVKPYGATIRNNNVLSMPTASSAPVDSGATQKVVALSPSMPDANYTVLVTPRWNSACYVSAKGTGYFTVTFSTPPQSASTIDYVVIHSL